MSSRGICPRCGTTRLCFCQAERLALTPERAMGITGPRPSGGQRSSPAAVLDGLTGSEGSVSGLEDGHPNPVPGYCGAEDCSGTCAPMPDTGAPRSLPAGREAHCGTCGCPLRPGERCITPGCDFRAPGRPVPLAAVAHGGRAGRRGGVEFR